MRIMATLGYRDLWLRCGLTGVAGLLLAFGMAQSLRAAPEAAPPPIERLQPMPLPQPGDDQRMPGPLDPAKPSAPPGSSLRNGQETPDLDTLFERLRTAKTEDEASLVNVMIEASMLKSGSDTIDLLMFRALSAVQNQDIALAMDLLDTVIALKPDYVEGWNKRATLYFMKRDYGKAISDVEMVLRLQPRHYHALIGLAQMLSELGDEKHALEALRRVLVIYPLNASVSKQAETLRAAVEGRAL